jgi:hypothetical protein
MTSPGSRITNLPSPGTAAMNHVAATATTAAKASRDAQICTCFLLPPTNVTSTCPKSCCENSPGSPSKRTTGDGR